MSMEALTSVSGNSYPPTSLPKLQEIKTAGQAEVEKSLKANGSTEIGEKALDEAIKRITEMMAHKNIAVDNYVNEETGVTQVVFSDKETGKVIRKFPADAVVEMANRAVKDMDSWLLDTFA